MMRRFCYTTLLISALSLFLPGTDILAQADVLEFEHLTLEDGLPNLRVEAIVQDYMGYIWIGTKRGLCRYNGYDFEVYKSNPLDTTTLRYHQISSLFEDRDNDLWIGTWQGGLHIYDREHDNIKRIGFCNTNNVIDISQDSGGYIWVGTNAGLHRYDKGIDKASACHFWSRERIADRRVLNIVQGDEETFVNVEGLGILRYDPGPDDFSPVLLLDECDDHNINEITEVFLYNRQIFWLGTDQGLFSFSPSGEIRLQRIMDDNQKGIYHRIAFIVNESYKNVWIGADGLYKYDIIANRITHHSHDLYEEYSLSNDFVTCGYTDHQGNTWIGTYAAGVNIIKNTSINFHKHSKINQQLDELSRDITVITRDNDRNLWLGTWDKGVLVFDEYHQRVESVESNYPALQTLSKEHIRALSRDPDGNIWIGSSSGLLTLIDRQKLQNEIYPLPVPDDELNSQLSVNCLLFESDSLMWVGTSKKGLFLFDLQQKKYQSFSDRQKVNDLNILDLERDRNGNIWIATYAGKGILRMDKNRIIRPYIFEGVDEKKFRNTNFITIYLDSRENLWFGTEFQGLIKLSPENKTTIFPISDDLNINEITAIQEDRLNRLWLATTQGLLRFDEASGTFNYYYWRDGLVSDEFNYNSSFQDDDNTIYLGGTNGLAYFKPETLRDNLDVPPVYIESLFIDNQEVRISDPGSPLKRPVWMTDKITLMNSQNVIGFEFVSLNYIFSGKNQYAYMLEGFDESGWNEIGNLRRMNFTNLDQGRYTLRVKASNNDGIWNEEGATLDIRVLPPPSLAWWAFIIYGVLFILITYLVYRVLGQQIRMRQQIRRQRFEKEQQVHLSNMKLDFFTNISHEFKTPLSLIISPLEEIIRNFKGSSETRQKLQMVQHNSNRLLRLIKLLIDFRKAEQDVLKLAPERHDMISLVKETVQSFESVVIEENKHIEMRTDLSSCVFEFDRNKMERVLYNLISNALSFTEELSEIIVQVSAGEQEENVLIEVHDTGIGIEEKYRQRIFEKFYQTEQPSGSNVSSTGSGIGLYLCKKIVELHHGEIRVDSTPGKGSVFTVVLPAAGVQSTEEEIVQVIGARDEAPGLEMLEAMEVHDPPRLPEDAPLVLLVEDHRELRLHIRKILWSFYRIEEAEDGNSGLEKARSLVPDLIISDIIMPGMDGVEMCSQIKRDPKTEHIPVILLSAKSDMDSKVEGYEKGADDFMEKPFFPQQLLARIRNLIESREKLKMHFGDGEYKRPKIAGIAPFDREFLEKVFYKIEQNIGNSEYNVNQLSSELGMSRVHLYRRFKDLTGKTPKDYMKETRLKTAAHLLEENRSNVSEVAYQVGFNTPSNFTASFKSFYGISPKEYKSS